MASEFVMLVYRWPHRVDIGLVDCDDCKRDHEKIEIVLMMSNKD